ncbi:putative toxin-antitoxin system toxin component, PIN family [Candidatus Pacearchaeota archaeon]|nr:putative toxin-antitoxin system toxin component, PIN family [Candidatus Pacearchaeota archaeon]
MRITLDTNVLISSTFWLGSSDSIMRKVENQELELIISKEIIEEFSKVLMYKEIQDKIADKNLDTKKLLFISCNFRVIKNQIHHIIYCMVLDMRRTIETITHISTIVEPKTKIEIIKDDPDDNKIIECAIEGKVDFIISQDNHLLNLKEFQGIKIVSPKEFLNKLLF